MGFNRAGKPAGYLRKNGYYYITLNGVEYRADRLIWKMIYNDPVPDVIEHINGKKADNRLENLRAKTGTAWRFTDEGNQRQASPEEVASAEAEMPRKFQAAMARDAE